MYCVKNTITNRGKSFVELYECEQKEDSVQLGTKVGDVYIDVFENKRDALEFIETELTQDQYYKPVQPSG